MKRFPPSEVARTYAEFGNREQIIWPSSKPKLLLKRLCSDCNNGWMSRLEDKAKPVFESILDGKLTALDTSTQLTIAKWAVKTAMVLEAIDSERTCFYTQSERNQIRAKLTIPDRSSVWIAKCVNHSNVYSAAKDHWTMPDHKGIHAFAITMAFGTLALQVVSIKTPDRKPSNASITYDISDGPWDQTLVQVWPSSIYTLGWPPQYGLDSEFGLKALTERLISKKKTLGENA